MVNMADCVAGSTTEMRQVVGGQRLCRCLFIDGVLVSYAEAATKTAVKDRLYTSAVELQFKSRLCLVAEQRGTPVRLVEEPFDEMLAVSGNSDDGSSMDTRTL